MLTPLDIHNKNFKRSFRGYDEDEIDDFLDEVVNDFEQLYRDNDKLKSDLERIEKDNAQYHALEENLKQTLVVAQKTAEEVMAASRKNAQELRDNTAKECQNMIHKADMEAKKKIEDALNKVRGIVADFERIVDARKQFLRKSKLALESELSLVTDAISELPDREAHEEGVDAATAASPEGTDSVPQYQTAYADHTPVTETSSDSDEMVPQEVKLNIQEAPAPQAVPRPQGPQVHIKSLRNEN